MSLIKGVGSVGIGASAGAIIPTPKKVVNEQIPSKTPEPPPPIENPSLALAARLGVDNSLLQKSRFNELVDQMQQAVSDAKSTIENELAKLKPSDLAGPLTLDPGKVINSVVETAKELVAWEQDVTDLKKLDEGDSLFMGGKGGLSSEFGVGQESSLEVKCTKKDANTGAVEYTVAVDVSPELSGSLGDFGGSIAPGTKLEYKFQSVEEVERFMKINGEMMSTHLSGQSGISKEDSAFLQQHASSSELKLTLGVQYDSKFGLGDNLKVGLQVGTKIQQSLRVEYENGKPVALVRITEISGTGVGKAGLDLGKSDASGKMPEGVPELGFKTPGGKHTLTVETRIPLDAAKLTDAPTLLADPLRSAMLDKAETTIKYTHELDTGRYGRLNELEITQVSPEETKQIVENLLQGKPTTAFENVKVDVKRKESHFEDKGLNINLDLKAKGYGIEYEARVERREVTIINQNEQKDTNVF